MIFAKRQVADMQAIGVDVRTHFLESRTRPGSILRSLLHIRERIRRERIDVVHSHFGTMTAFIGALVAFDRRLVITYRGSDLNHASGDPIARSLAARFLSQVASWRAQAAICVSEELQGRLWTRRGISVVMPSGVDTDAFKPSDRLAARRQLGWPEDEFAVLFNHGASQSANKRRDLAEAAVESAKRCRPTARLRVVAGDVPGDRMPMLMNASDALLLTSDKEGSPTVVQEAMACGVPVVSVDVGDVRQRLHRVSNSTVTDRDPVALAEALSRIPHGARSNGREALGGLSVRDLSWRCLAIYTALAAHRCCK